MARLSLLVLLSLLVACGDDTTSGSGGNGGTSGAGGSAGLGGSAGTGGSAGSGGAGGSMQPDGSFSIKWGPAEVPANFEGTQCVVKRLGNSAPISVHEIHNVLGATSHHFIVYKVDDEVERPDPYSCTPFTDTFNDPPLIITQRADDRLTLPEGVAYTIEPNQMLRLELHYVNVNTTPQLAEATSTFVTMPSEEVENEADIMFLGDTAISIPAMSEATLGPSFLRVPDRFDGVSYFAITGHEHQWGTDVYVEVTESEGMAGTPVYDLPFFLWDEPETITYDPPFTIPTGGGFNLTCEWNNLSNRSVSFGTSVDDEMCFIWAYYFPSRGPLICANGLFGCN